MDDDLDQATKDRIRKEEAYRAQVRAEEEQKLFPLAASPLNIPAPPQKKSGMSCGGLIFGGLAAIAVLYACGNSLLSSSSTINSLSTSSTQSDTASSPASSWGYDGIGDGTHQVGSEMAAGTYRTRAASPGCYWARLAGLSGETGDIKANENTRGPAVVSINASDAGFESSGCAPWTTDLSSITSSPDASFSDGTFIVGTDISPGTWKASDPSDCYWARLSDFGGGNGSIIANDNGGGVVTISSDDKGFTSSRCGDWTRT